MKRGSIALARELCVQIAGYTDDDQDQCGHDYGSVDIAEILSAEVERLREALAQPEQQAEPVQEQKYEKRIAPYSTTLSMLLNTTPPQQQAEPVQENKTLIEWKERGEAIMAQAGVGFRLGAWWADRPWRQK